MMNVHSTYLNNRYFQCLDGIRFLSILAVIWHHSRPAGLPEVFTRGFLGVDMFFVLSGFLIVTLLLREKENNHQKISLKNFYIRRALRIFPVYFGLLLALSALYGIVKPDDPDSKQFFSLLPIYLAFVANWSLVHVANLGIYWSLATEEQFYLVWPLIEKLFKPKAVLMVLGLFLVINQLINFGYLDSFFIHIFGREDIVSLSILDVTFTPICLGVLLAHLLHNKQAFDFLFPLLGSRLASLLAFGALFAAIIFSSGDISGLERLIIQLAMVIWLASLVIREDNSFARIMTISPVKRLGQISYGMYVYHMFALHIARALLERFGIGIDYSLFIFGFIISVVVAEMSFRLYEAPILSFAKYFRAKEKRSNPQSS